VIRGESKVTRAHLERAAIVYVRQSTLVQVREHTESTLRQYDLAGQAARLGWAAADIEVIDADLGLSGRTASHRDGFKQLVARVCLGEVGAVFGLEVSRLARSNADLARLLELARLTGTLVIDNDGVYDLSDINDRLLLGLKSQMSEAELHWSTSRMNEAKRAAARRGELRVPLPVGFVYDDDGAVVIDPDEEVAAAISDVFAAFTAAGSAYGVAGTFAGRRFPRRAYGGVWAGQLRWGRLTHARAAGILRNPAYAGAYVFGRRRSRQVVDPDGLVRSSVTELPRDQWEVLIPDHHQGYITWEAYLANEAKLAANRTNAGARPPREGSALCQGIVFCGACGRSMQVRYQDRYPRYECSHSRADHVATPLCGSVRADTIDEAVAPVLLAAVGPAQVALALAAAEEVTTRRQRSVRAAELAVERARYDADRAERAFLACEPENRLVARTWRPGGKPGSPVSPAPRRRSPRSAPPSPSCPALTSSPSPSPTCPPSGRPRPPATRTASGCCAPCWPTSPSPPQPATPPISQSGCAGNRGPASRSTSPGAAAPSSCAAPAQRRSSSPAASAPAWTTPPSPRR
jgi:DNA invertase Pin-like site-specific DNA recombinase